MNIASSMTRPDWLEQCDRTIDITKEWREATDPRNEWGETCDAHLGFVEGGAYLMGITVRDGGQPSYHRRDHAMKILGIEGVWSIEDTEMEAGSGDFVDHADFCRACRGTGGGYDRSWYTDEPAIFTPCRSCRGTGKRTVRVEPAA